MTKEDEKNKALEDKKAFQALSRRVMHLHHVWHEYAALFRQPAIDTKLDLMNRTAPTFFRLVQLTWLDQLFLEIGKLMDPAGKGERETLGFESLIAKIGDPSLEPKIGPLKKNLDDLYSNIKDWRNKRIAHNDWKHYMGLRPLKDVAIDDIEKLISGLDELTDMVAQHCFDHCASCKPDEVKGGAEKLLRSLSKCQQEDLTQSAEP
jgi:hypothetical protein